MFLLLFLVLVIQFFTYWIFDPLTSFAEYIFEIKLFPIIALLVFFLLFSAKHIEDD